MYYITGEGGVIAGGGLLNWDWLNTPFKKTNFDGIIHCAAKVGGVGSNIKYKGEFFYDNIMMNTNVIIVLVPSN